MAIYRTYAGHVVRRGQLRDITDPETPKASIETFMAETARQLGELIDSRKLNKKTLSERAGVARSTIYRILDATTMITIATASNIALALGVPIHEILYDKCFVINDDCFEPNIEEFNYCDPDKLSMLPFTRMNIQDFDKRNLLSKEAFRKTVSYNLKKAKRDGWTTQQYLATSANISLLETNRYMNGVRVPSPINLINTCFALDESVDNIVPRDRFVDLSKNGLLSR